MKKNQRLKYEYTNDYRKQKTGKFDPDELQIKPKQESGDLKSLQCSSVHEVQPTNQSYQMSWLEKLVNNMDQDKQSHIHAEHVSRNFSRKNSTNLQSNYTAQKSNQIPTRNRNAYSTSKYDSQYTPISKINQIAAKTRNDNYLPVVNRFKQTQNQRLTRKYLNSAQKYQVERKYSAANYQKQITKDVDLNESNQSYGRIKRINKPKQQIQISSKYSIPQNLQQIQISVPRPYLGYEKKQQKDRERFVTQTSAIHNIYQYRTYEPKDYFKQSDYKTYQKTTTKNQIEFSRGNSAYNKKGQEKDKINYSNLSFKQKYESPIKIENDCKQKISEKKPKDEKKNYQKQDDFKMDEMAKRLNMVLENINKKSKMFTQPHQQQKSYQQSKANSLNNYNSAATISEHKIQSDLQQKVSINQKQIHSNTFQELQRRPRQSLVKQQRIYLEPKQQILANNYIAHQPIQRQQRLKQLQQQQQMQQKQQNHQSKYQMMKKSLGMSKHIPHEIILQESSSQINSQISPRTQFLNRQFRNIFDKLDKNKTGELNKNNCGLELISDEIKYIFGGIFSKIKYKGQKVLFKGFLEQCQNITKQFQFKQLKQVLCKSRSIPQFQYNQKQVESQKWNNQTNNDIESKRSSDRSEVVKKYDFTQENKQQKYRGQNENRLKVHWAAPSYRNPDLLNYDQINKQKKRDMSKSPYQIRRQVRQEKFLQNKDENKKIISHNQIKAPLKIFASQKIYQRQQQLNGEKQNVKTSQTQKEKKDFEKLCENLNNKLNNYLTTITKKVSSSGPHIPLQFSELSKHWNISKH